MQPSQHELNNVDNHDGYLFTYGDDPDRPEWTVQFKDDEGSATVRLSSGESGEVEILTWPEA
jgi:hypothetical protein